MPMYYYLWTDHDEDHVAQHGVSRGEFEDTVNAARRKDERRQENGYFRVDGYTAEGREIRCVYEKIDELWVRPVTAHDL